MATSPSSPSRRRTGNRAARCSGRFVVTRRSRRSANLPGRVAGAALHPPLVPARAVPNLQDGPEESRIARGNGARTARVAEGGRVIGVEPNTTLGLLVDVLGPALADRPPMPVSTSDHWTSTVGSASKILQLSRRSRCVPSVKAGNEPPPDAVSVRPVLGKAEREHGLLEP